MGDSHHRARRASALPFAARSRLRIDHAGGSHHTRLDALDLRVALRAHRVEAVRSLHARVRLVVERRGDARQLEEKEIALVRAEGYRARCILRKLLDRAERGLCRWVEEVRLS